MSQLSLEQHHVPAQEHSAAISLSDEQLDDAMGGAGCSGSCPAGKQPVLIIGPDGSYTVVCA